MGEAVIVLGVPIWNMTVSDALAHLGALLNSTERHTLFFVNAHTLDCCVQSPGYLDVLKKADLVFGDGTGVRWAARMRGARMRANLNGTDLIPLILDNRPGTRCFLLGNTPERIGRAANTFKGRFPACELVGAHHGYLDHGLSLRAIELINAEQPDILLVGMGNPLQEEWINRYRSLIRTRLIVGVGGLLDYWAGSLDRANPWMRKFGIEWLHILRRQPWKAERYLVRGPLFLYRSLALAREERRQAALYTEHLSSGEWQRETDRRLQVEVEHSGARMSVRNYG
jgi:N-acetylglucosaminyldiphosphoundecaprenol N-acetyl-beta-D-mannosaminyltransferase